VSWTTFPTLTDGQILTGAHMQLVRDNFAETAPAKATAAGQIPVSTGANSIAMRVPTSAHLSTSDTTTTVATFGDLSSTVGPAVTVTTGTQALVIYTSYMANSASIGGALMSYAVSGASTIAASLTNAARQVAGAATGSSERWSTVSFQSGLTPGSNTFTTKYTTATGGTASFFERELTVIPL